MTALGVVGRGVWSENICKTLDGIPGVEWMRLNADRRSAPAGIDGVIIANRSQDHVETAIPFLEDGISCFIEKPVALSLVDFGRLRQSCLASGAEIFSGHIHCFNPAVQCFVNEMSTLGDVISLNGVFCNSKPRADVSVLWDWLPHPVSIAQLIFAHGPNRVKASAHQGLVQIDDVRAELFFGDIPFAIHANWLSPQARMEIACVCERGVIVFDDKASSKVRIEQNNKSRFPVYAADLPLLLELQAFVSLLRGHKPNVCGLDQAGYVTSVIEALHQSIGMGGVEVISN